jgi:hypothetical protein
LSARPYRFSVAAIGLAGFQGTPESRAVQAPGGIAGRTIFQFCRLRCLESPIKSMGLEVFVVNFGHFILCNPYASKGVLSVMLMLNGKIIGQVRFVYQLHPRGKRFRQTARHD